MKETLYSVYVLQEEKGDTERDVNMNTDFQQNNRQADLKIGVLHVYLHLLFTIHFYGRHRLKDSLPLSAWLLWLYAG
jgi:hypothetical protein